MRASGILMPVFSLPGPFGIGTLGSEATAFVDFLAEAKQTYWQILPIGPTGYGDSPYQSFSAFAGNPYFIDFRLLAADGYLTAEEIPAAQPVNTVDYGALYNQRPVLLKKAADRLLAAPSPAYEAFCAAQSFWLEDYALFMAVKAEQGQAGLADWPDALRCREPEAIAAAKARLADQICYHKAVQFFFYTQWNALKAYANRKGVLLVGDIPIYVSPDSSDLWTHPELFQTDGQMHLTHVAGCPPEDHAVCLRQPGVGQLPAPHLPPQQCGVHRHPRQCDHRGLAQQRQCRGRGLCLPVPALHTGDPDRRHDLRMPCQRFGYRHHPAGRLAASGQRGPHQHSQHTRCKLALAVSTASAPDTGRTYCGTDDPV